MNRKAQVVVREDSASPVVVKYAETYGPEGIDIRQHFIPKDADDDELRPTKKGARIPMDERAEFTAGVLRIAYDLTEDDLRTGAEAVASMVGQDNPLFKALMSIADGAHEVTT
jgi:hypothetical protein